jgi:hypothetical protein
MPALHYEIGSRQVLTLPDGTILPTVFKGYLSGVSKLPLHGSGIGDMYGVGDGLWVLSTIPNTSRVGWIDPPPGDQAPRSNQQSDGHCLSIPSWCAARKR